MIGLRKSVGGYSTCVSPAKQKQVRDNRRSSQVRDLAGLPQKILRSTRRVTDPARAQIM